MKFEIKVEVNGNLNKIKRVNNNDNYYLILYNFLHVLLI